MKRVGSFHANLIYANWQSLPPRTKMSLSHHSTIHHPKRLYYVYNFKRPQPAACELLRVRAMCGGRNGDVVAFVLLHTTPCDKSGGGGGVAHIRIISATLTWRRTGETSPLLELLLLLWSLRAIYGSRRRRSRQQQQQSSSPSSSYQSF